MRITHLSTYDLAGGAARAAYRLHTGLCSIGHESRFVTLHKSSTDPTVLEFVPPRDAVSRLRRGLRRRYLERSGSEVLTRPAGSTYFSDDRSQHGADVLRQMPPTDVINLHWIAGFFDYRDFYRHLPPQVSIVWTLHDMNAFTGGCHYDEMCGKFREKCGACPQLGSCDHNDFSSRVWLRKLDAFSAGGAAGLQIVTPSRWLAEEVNKSALLSDRPVRSIPNGVDIDCFQPRDRQIARAKYGIPPAAKMVLFVADSTGEKRKGLKTLLEAVKRFEGSEEFLFVAIGGGLIDKHLGGQFRTIGFVPDETALAFLYSAADIFVVPSLQDNLPNTAVEALACGVPTIGSNVGGIPEIIRDKETGLLVPPGDPRALGEAIATLLRNPELRILMARESRHVALQEYDLRLQTKSYADLYEQVVGSASTAQTAQ